MIFSNLKDRFLKAVLNHPWLFSAACISLICDTILRILWLYDPSKYERAEPALDTLRWLALLFGIPSILDFLFGRHKEDDNNTATNISPEPTPLVGSEKLPAYKKDKFFNLIWRWNRSLTYNKLKIVKICCPICEMEVDLEYLEESKIGYRCADHGIVATFYESPDEVERRVLKIVERNYETDEWKNIVKRQQANVNNQKCSLNLDQITWLTTLATRSNRSELVNTREILVKLNNQLSPDFDPTNIDQRLCVGGNRITVFGRALVNPQDKHVQETNTVANAVRSILIENPNILSISALEIAKKSGLSQNDVAEIFENMAGFIGGNYFHNSGTSNGPTGWASINIDQEVLTRYINFQSVERILAGICN